MTSLSAFSWAAARRLSSVDVDPTSSNQHELGSVGRLHRHLVAEARLSEEDDEAELVAAWLLLRDDEEPRRVDEPVTCYDARRKSPHRRPEWRLYYRAGGDAEAVLRDQARPGDVIVYAVPVTSSPDVAFLIAPAGSQWERALLRLFPLDEVGGQLQLIPEGRLTSAQDLSHARLLAEWLGLGVHAQSDIDWLRERLGDDLGQVTFPTTAQMAALAAERLGIGDERDADARLLDLLDTETRLFYALENVQALPRFRNECETTDDYLELAKSLLQRRRSRRGHSFELHLGTVFTAAGLRYETQQSTEPGSIVDFIFPDLATYHFTPDPPDGLVVHMNAKTTARERWKQILKEAARLSRRHLGTLDPNLSHSTLLDTARSNLQVVMPRAIRDLYDDESQRHLWTVERFIEHVASTQRT